MVELLAQSTVIENTIAGAIVLAAIAVATSINKASIRREDKRVAAYEEDLRLRREADDEDKKLRREADKEHRRTIEHLTRENHRNALVQMKERTQLDSKNLETLGVISEAVAAINGGLQKLSADMDIIKRDGKT